MKRIVIYTTIGTVLIILGVFTSPSKASAAQSTTATQISAVNISSMDALITRLMTNSNEDKDALRTFSILRAMEEGKITERQAEILNYLEDLVPFEKSSNVFNELSSSFSVTKDEFLSLRPVMEEIGLDINLYY